MCLEVGGGPGALCLGNPELLEPPLVQQQTLEVTFSVYERMMEVWLSSVCEELHQRGTLSISYCSLWSTMMSLHTLSALPGMLCWRRISCWIKFCGVKLSSLYEAPGVYLRKRCLFIRWSRYFILATVIIISVLYFGLSRSSDVVRWGLFNLQRDSSASLSAALLPPPLLSLFLCLHHFQTL